MSTRVLLKESELVSMIKKIIKESKFSYSDFDYMSAFFQIFHNWLKKNTPEEVWSYPTSYLIQKYSKPFLKSLGGDNGCLLYTSPSPRDRQKYRMPSSA